MRKTICVNCGRAMKVKRIGATALEFIDAEKQKPYKLWRCDIQTCPTCGLDVINNFAERPVAYHHEDTFFEELSAAKKEGEIVEFY